MRILFSLEGPQGGWTREAFVAIGCDAVHVFHHEASPGIEELGGLVERAGGTFQAEPVPGEDLLTAFKQIHQAMKARAEDTRICSVNAGKDANLLSAAGLLACLEEGVEAHFLHEQGHTRVPVLTPKPLGRMLGQAERQALSGFPEAGLAVAEAGEHDTAALNGLKARGLIELEAGVLRLSAVGRSYRDHLLG